MRHYITFSATGVGPFPMDMLRRLPCWPRSTEDVMEIVHSIAECRPRGKKLDGGWDQVRTIWLTCCIDRKPTPKLEEEIVERGRWVSFGWRINGYRDWRITSA